MSAVAREPFRVALLGGTSAFTPALAAALAERAATLDPLELRVHGRDARKAELVAACCEHEARRRGAAQRWSAAPRLEDALDGADVVVEQVRVGGFAGRRYDESFPHAVGLPGDETIGPGGLASALRALPTLCAHARAIERRAPDAVVLLLSNPLGIALRALARVTRLRIHGLCELPGETLRRAEQCLELAPGELSASYVGHNHQGFFVDLATRDGARGHADLLAELGARLAQPAHAASLRTDADALRALDALPLSYMRLYLRAAQECARQRAAPGQRAAELAALSRELHAALESDPDALPEALLSRRSMPWLHAALVPALEALAADAPRRLFISSANDDGWGTERDGVLSAGAFTPAARTRTPASGTRVAHWVRSIGAYEELAAAAALEPSESSVRDALRASPFELERGTVDALVPLVLAAGGQA